jgi:glutamate carboxypeptidase
VQCRSDRPPLPSSASAELYVRAERCAGAVGIDPLDGVEVGGGSDGNFTAAVGTPTLDGLGAVGAGAHAEGEHVIVEKMAERAALVAALIDDLCKGEN